MSRIRRLPMIMAGATAGVALATVAGCGGGGSSGSGTSGYGGGSPTSSVPTGGTSGQTIKAASVGSLGPILVDGTGRTVYLFEKDTGGKSSCSGACTSVWPPVTTSVRPQPGSGADASKLSTTKRSDGTTEVSYSGHPLYYYAPDGTSGGSTGGKGSTSSAPSGTCCRRPVARSPNSPTGDCHA